MRSGIQKQVKAEAPTKVNVEFEVGETLRVIDGPFTDFHGKVDRSMSRKATQGAREHVRPRDPVELDLLQVERLR